VYVVVGSNRKTNDDDEQLTFSSLAVSLRTTRFNIQQLYVLPTQCIHVFCTDLRTESNLCFKHREMIGFYSSGGKFTAWYRLIPYIKQITFSL
jgi:hypothetical protein